MIIELAEPPALVARAEICDGIQRLANEISAHYREQRSAQARADMHGLEIGRLICEYAASAEVVAKLAILNAKAEGGRPKSAHCYVAEQVFLSGIERVTQRHMERCARAFQKAQKNGLPISTPLRVAEASAAIEKFTERQLDDAQPSPERLFNFDSAETENEKEPTFDPEREAAEIAKKIHSYFVTREGHVRFRTQDQRRKFFEALNRTLEQLGIEAALAPEGSN